MLSSSVKTQKPFELPYDESFEPWQCTPIVEMRAAFTVEKCTLPSAPVVMESADAGARRGDAPNAERPGALAAAPGAAKGAPSKEKAGGAAPPKVKLIARAPRKKGTEDLR